MIVISQIILQLIFVNILFQNFDKSNYSEKIPNSDLSIEMIFNFDSFNSLIKKNKLFENGRLKPTPNKQSMTKSYSCKITFSLNFAYNFFINNLEFFV